MELAGVPLSGVLAETELIMGIGKRIKELRARCGLTQETLAKKIGVTPAAVGNYEHDLSFPKEEVLMKLFGALCCSPNELLCGEYVSDAEETVHLNKYRALDTAGKQRVNALTDAEFARVNAERSEEEYEEIPIAARRAGAGVVLRKKGGQKLSDMRGFKGKIG